MLQKDRINDTFQEVSKDIKALNDKSLNVVKVPNYRYRDFWSEEAAAISSNQPEWSYANGASGYIGLPIGPGWDVAELAFNADVYAAGARVEINLMSYNTPTNAVANIIATIILENENDGGGGVNNAYKHIEFPPGTHPIPAGVVGVFTRSVTGGSVSDARIYSMFRKQDGDRVVSVAFA